MTGIIFFIESSKEIAEKRLKKTIQAHFPSVPQETYDTIEGFRQRLCRPIRQPANEIYVVYAEERIDQWLEQLMELKEILEGRKLVMIFPVSRKQILSKAHRLSPRYVSHETEGFTELLSVLEKIIEKMGVETIDNKRAAF